MMFHSVFIPGPKFHAIVPGLITIAFLAAATPAHAGPPHEDDIEVGVNALGQIVLILDEESIELPPISGLLNGFGVDDPGFLSIDAPEPKHGAFPLDPAAIIALEVVSFAPAFKGWTPGFASVFRLPGDQWVIGSAPFDEHPFWHIDSDDPAFDPNQSAWDATFRLVDLREGSAHLPSDPLTITFTPEPSAAAAIAGIGLLMLRRKHIAMRGGRP